ncbi:hypothetical protein BHE74_00044426, partial [Ensete ventricosum]
MRRHLVLQLGDKASPSLPARGLGNASFSRWKRGVASSYSSRTRRSLVFLRGDETTPRSPARRGYA